MARRSPTLATTLEDWLTVRSAGRGLSPNTARAYRADIAAVAGELAKPADGDDRPTTERITVDQLTPDAVVRALAALQRAGRSAATRARIHGTLAGLCAHLVHKGQMSVDPLVAAGLERSKLPKSLPRYVERDTEIARVLIAAGTPDPTGRQPWPERDLALAAMLAGTGARASEVCGVRIRDLILDVEDPYVRVTGKGRRGARLPACTRSSHRGADLPGQQAEARAGAHGATIRRGSTITPDRSHRQRSTTSYAGGSPAPGCPTLVGQQRMPSGTPWRCSWWGVVKGSTSCRRCADMLP
jgi:site-specific recombinase XerC